MSRDAGFSRPLPVNEVSAEGRSFAFEASAAERDVVAVRLGLAAVHWLKTEGTLQRGEARTRYRLNGRLQAKVVQTCVVTLQPLDVSLDVPVERDYATDVADEWSAIAPAGSEIVLSLATEDGPDPVVGGVVDVGAAAVEDLALTLDPFPRAPGAAFAAENAGESGGGEQPASEEGRTQGAFAALARLKTTGGRPDE